MIIAIVTLFFASPADAERLRETAPAYLDVASARAHYGAARLAGLLYGVEPEILLGIAWHESRYDASVETREPGHRVSCGVLTPEPKRVCDGIDHDLVGGYLRGAQHLRRWRDLCRGDDRCALTAYAGGGRMVSACRAGSDHRACRFAMQMISRARWIGAIRRSGRRIGT